MADFGILGFFLRRRAGSSGLQIDRGGASATAGAFEGAISGGRILLVAGDYAVTGVCKTCGGDCAGDGGAGGSGLAGRLPLGGISEKGRAAAGGAAARGYGLHRLFVGDGRASQGMRAHARQLSGAVYLADGVLPILAGRALFEYSAHESRDRFHGGIYWAVRLWSLRGPFADAASGICARCICALSHHLCEPGADGAEESGTRATREVR